MTFGIKGYLLEPPRVAQANSAFTMTPSNFLSNAGTFHSYYPDPLTFPAAETNPRVDYMALVTKEGALSEARFGWTKNEIVARFDYDGSLQRYRTLPGAPIEILGVLKANSNTAGTRLNVKVTPVLTPFPAATAPFRVSIGNMTYVATLVSSFGAPSAGNVEILTVAGSGNLRGDINWNSADLAANLDAVVKFQRQAFYSFKESSGKIGLSTDTLYLNPLPGSAQYPLLRFGFGPWLVPIPRITFSGNPATGEFQWIVSTGEVRFNSTDASAGVPVYYDGVLMAMSLALAPTSLGTIPTPSTYNGALVGSFTRTDPGSDFLFRLGSGVQFENVSYTDQAPTGPGTQGTIVIYDNGSTFQPYVSYADCLTYYGQSLSVTPCNLPIERGISLQLYRTPVNLSGASDGPKDVTCYYETQDAIWASPIIGAPEVFLPVTPLHPAPTGSTGLTVHVTQGTGTYPEGDLPNLSDTTPSGALTYGYLIDYETKRLKFAFRKNDTLVPMLQPAGAVVLPDPLIQEGLSLEIETGLGTNRWRTLTEGTDFQLEGTTGQVSFTKTVGTISLTGTGTFSGTTFTDSTATFTGQVFVGDTLVTGTQVRSVLGVGTNTLTLDVSGTGTSTYEVHHGRETVADRYFTPLEFVDPGTKVERVLPLGTIQNATAVVSTRTPTSYSNTVLTDTSVDFEALGVVPGDTIIMVNGPTAGSAHVVTIVEPTQLTTSNSFSDFDPSHTYRIERRLHVPLQWLDQVRFRLGSTFASTVSYVNHDSDFTGVLAAGVVNVSRETGNLDFSPSDVTQGYVAYWVRTLKARRDYTLTAALGFLTFTDRFMKDEECLVTYSTVDPDTNLPVVVGTETVGFAVRMEKCQAHPDPTSVLHFNPTGKTIASLPAPEVNRGGRPQDNTQVLVNTIDSTVTFLSDSIFTDALPHGSIVGPDENIYVNYYVTGAFGGEHAVTVLYPPMSVALVNIALDATGFTVLGDQTSTLPSGYLIRVEGTEVHQIATSTFDGTKTTVNLNPGDKFQDTYQSPKLYISSAACVAPGYFPIELATFTVARGMNKVVLAGDRTTHYKSGTVIFLADIGSTYQHWYLVSGVYLDVNGNTVLILHTNTRQEYTSTANRLRYSIRSIVEDGTKTFATTRPPVLTEAYGVYRKVSGQVGRLLTLTTDYLLDSGGALSLATPLVPAEELAVYYTGYSMQAAGPRLKASYTALTVPTAENGLAGQNLTADFTIFSPDTFYFRVETMTNFRNEVLQEYRASAQASIPSSGPIMANSSGSQLYNQGRPSLYFDEKHLANQDICARLSLYWYNTTIDYLEDCLQDMDGRVVGNHDGRFKFNLTRGVRIVPPNPTLNQIDDIIKVSDAPYRYILTRSFFFPVWEAVTPSVYPYGTWVQAYTPSEFSRFYPTTNDFFAVTAAGANTGDPIFDTGWKPVLTLQPVHTRYAWAIVTEVALAGQTRVYVDNPYGSEEFLRPAFKADADAAPELGYLVLIKDPDGNDLLTYTPVVNGSPPPAYTSGSVIYVTAIGYDADHGWYLTLSNSLPVDVPTGSTVYQNPVDPHIVNYVGGVDYGLNSDTGQGTYFSDADRPLTAGLVISGGITLLNTLMAPYKFPALYGGIADDSGDITFPILTPYATPTGFTFEYRELDTLDGAGTPTTKSVGYLQEELTLETNFPSTTTTYTGTGHLSGLNTIILDSGTFPSPTPKLFDLVRITSGTNSGSAFRRISSAPTTTTIVLDSNFVSDGSSFTFEVAVSNSPVTTSSGAILSGHTKLQDALTRDLVSLGVEIGHTVVIENLAGTGDYRQIVGFDTTTSANDTLVVDHAFSGSTGSTTYRVSNAEHTFGGPGSNLERIVDIVDNQLDLYNGSQTNPLAAIPSLEAFFGQVFTGLGSGTNGSSNGSTTFTDMTVDFTSFASVNNILYIRTGLAKGVYKVIALTTTTLTVDSVIPSASSVDYTVNSVFGVGIPALKAVFDVLDDFDHWLLVSTVFNMFNHNAISVIKAGSPDTDTYASTFTGSMVAARGPLVASRITDYQSLLDTLNTVLLTTDRLYDKRYTWIDARINQQNGLLVKAVRAMINRLKAQADIANQLFKILALQAG